MANGKFDFSLGLNQLTGTDDPTGVTPTGLNEQLAEYDEGMPTGMEAMFAANTANAVNNAMYNNIAQQRATQNIMSQQQALGIERQQGPAPEQALTPMDAVNAMSGGAETSRALAAGWGDIVKGTGDAIDVINAAINPEAPDLTTSIGDHLRKVGEQYNMNNMMVMSEDLKDMTFGDLFKAEYWTHKTARQLPYSLSFFIPAGLGAAAVTRFGGFALRALHTAGMIGKATKVVRAALTGTRTGAVKYVDEVIEEGSGLGRMLKAYKTKTIKDKTGKVITVAAKEGLELTGKAKTSLAVTGGFSFGNFGEGMYIAGEAYNQAANEVDDMGNPVYDKEMLSQFAAGVMKRNAAWMGVDALSFGILFGGFGKMMKLNRVARIAPDPTAFGVGIRPFLQWGARKAAAGLPAMAAYGGVEGIVESYQEVYQEWAKYATKADIKGEEYESWTKWLKNAQTDPHLKDIFWSSFGLGAVMGGTRGYIDGIAEQTRMYDEKVNGFNYHLDQNKENVDPYMQQKREENWMNTVISNAIIDHEGSGQVIKDYIEARVQDKNNSLTEEEAGAWISAIESQEKDFAKHNADTRLNRAGKVKVFLRQVQLSKIKEYREQVEESYKDEKSRNEEIYKNDEKALEKANAQSEADYLAAIATLEEEGRRLSNEIADVYSARRAKLTKAGKPKKSSLGLSEEEFQELTIEGEKKAEKEGQWEGKTLDEIKQIQEGQPIEQGPTVTEQAIEGAKAAPKAAAAGIVSFGKKAYRFIRDKITGKNQISRDLDAVKDIKMEDDVRTAVEKSIKDGVITAKDISTIKGTGAEGAITNSDFENFLNEKTKTQEAQIIDSGIDMTDPNNIIIKKSEVMEEIRKRKGDTVYTQEEYDAIEKELKEKKAEENKKGKETTKQEKTKEAGIKLIKGKKNITKTAKKKAIQLIEEGKLDYKDIPKKGTGANGTVTLPDINKALKKKAISKAKPSKKAKKKETKVTPKQDKEQTKESIWKRIKGKVASGASYLKGKVKGVLETIDEEGTTLDKQVEEALEAMSKNMHFRPWFTSGLAARGMAELVVQEQFPGSKAYLITNRLLTEYGEEATALAIGSGVFITENELLQTGLIHELGHVYYGLYRDTPLMKRIVKLLAKSEEYDIVYSQYPELVRIKVDGKYITAGELYLDVLKNGNKKLSNPTLDLVEAIHKAQGTNDAKFRALMVEFINQLKLTPGFEVAKKSEQHGILEEMFVRSLEAASAGTLNTIIPGTKEQKQLEADLLEMYKTTKNLTNKEDAKKFLELTDENIKSMTLEQAIRHVLLNFNTKGAKGIGISNSYRKGQTIAAKKINSSVLAEPLVQTIIGRHIAVPNQEELIDKVIQDIKKHSSLTLTEENEQFVRQYIINSIVRFKLPNAIKKGDTILDERIKNLAPHLLEDKVDVLEDSDFIELDEESFVENYNEEGRRRALGPTTMNFIRKYEAVYNNKFKEPLNQKALIHQLFSLAQQSKKDPYDFVVELRKNQAKYKEIQKTKKTLLETGAEGQVINEDVHNEAARFLNFLDSIYKAEAISDAKLMHLSNDFANGVIERMSKMELQITRKKDGNKYVWKRLPNITVNEGRKIDGLIKHAKNSKNKNKITNKISKWYSAILKDKEGEFGHLRKQNAAIQILKSVFEGARDLEFIDWGALRNQPIIFKGKRMFISDILFGGNTRGLFWDIKWKMKDGKRIDELKSVTPKKYQLGMEGSMNSLKEILKESMILSRPRNFLLMVEDVEYNAVSVYNKESSLTNSVKNINEIRETGENQGELINPNYNRFVENSFNGEDVEVVINSGIYNHLMQKFSDFTNDNFIQRASKFKNLAPEELMLSDFFDFAERFVDHTIYKTTKGTRKRGNKKTDNDLKDSQTRKYKVIQYQQPVSVFSDKSRRYNIISEMAYNQETLNRILKPLYNNPRRNAKYENGELVLPFNIIERDGNYFIAEESKGKNKNKRWGLKELREEFKKQLGDNKQYVSEMNAVTLAKEAGSVIELIDYYLQSYIANKFMAQQMLVGDHQQFKNEIDYVKRAAGAIAPQIPFDRNSSFEAVIFKDYVVLDNGEIIAQEEDTQNIGHPLTDAMGFVLPEQAKLIRQKYGNVRKVGNIFKFVYHYRETSNPNMLGKTTYLKFAVHEITPKMERLSPHFKRLADTLRARVKNIAQSKYKDYSEELMFAHNHLVIGTAKSAAKVFLNKENKNDYIYDLDENHNLDYINQQQDELYYSGAENSTLRYFSGLHGEGLGLQLELDKESKVRQVPSQVFYHLATNANTKVQQEKIDNAYKLMREIKELWNAQENSDIIGVGKNSRENIKQGEQPTEAQIKKERLLLENSISPEIYGSAKASLMGYIDDRYPGVNAIFSGMAVGRITKHGTKLPTKGAIMYQSSDLGIGLQAYKRINDLVDENGNLTFELEEKWGEENNKKYKEGLISVWNKSKATGVDYLVSEAIIPDFMKRKHNVSVGEMFIGTRVPAHGKVSTAIFVVRDFHEPNFEAPSSVITIPAEVSSKWGADLDGDAVHTNFYWNENDKGHSASGKVNQFLDIYTDVLSEKERENEVTQELEFEESHKEAGDIAYDINGLVQERDMSQLTPTGDMEQFRNNVPATGLVGRVAATQRIVNLMAKEEESLPIKIKIKGHGKDKFNSHEDGKVINKFTDGINKETNQEYWYGVAQLLNVILDNAKHQLAGKLGINTHTAATFILLRRLGFSIKDLAILFNSEVVRDIVSIKEKMKRTTVSDTNAIDRMLREPDTIEYNAIVQYLESLGIELYEYNELGNITKSERWNSMIHKLKTDGVTIDLNNLNSVNTKANIALMFFVLDKFNQKVLVNGIGQAHTTHQTIEKNPIKLQNTVNIINELVSEKGIDLIEGKDFNLTYKLKPKGGVYDNNITQSALDIFDSILSRARVRDIRFSPAVQRALKLAGRLSRVEKNRTFLESYLADNEKAKAVFNQWLADIFAKELGLNLNQSKVQLVNEFKKLQEKYPDNMLLNQAFTTYGNNLIVLDYKYVNNLTSEEAYKVYRDEFDKLQDEEKSFMLDIEYVFNQFGLGETTFAPLYSQSYMEGITGLLDIMHQRFQNAEHIINYNLREAQEKVERTEDYVPDVMESLDAYSKKERGIQIKPPKAKKAIKGEGEYRSNHQTSHTEYYSDKQNLMSISEWAKDKNLDLERYKQDKEAMALLKNRYQQYVDDFNLVEQFEEEYIRSGNINKMSINELYDVMNKFAKLDNSASNRAMIHLRNVLANKAFQSQVAFLKEKGMKQGFTYKTPGLETKQKDISWIRKWFGANNMTSERPEIQFLINEVEQHYIKFIRRFRLYSTQINKFNKALVKSKQSELSVIQKIKGELSLRDKYEYIYGNILVEDKNGLRLKTTKEMNDSLTTQEERDYWKMYKDITENFQNIIEEGRGKIKGKKLRKNYIPHTTMGTLEAMSAKGLYGLYALSTGSTFEIDYVQVYGLDVDGKEKLKTYKEWREEVYKDRTQSISLKSGRKIYELDKLRRKAIKLKQQGIHDDGSLIELSEIEADSLNGEGGLLNRFAKGRTARAKDLVTYDINKSLLEYTRSTLFAHGDMKYDGTKADKSRFVGMGNVSMLIDAVKQYNEKLGNENAVEYLTKWWKEGFIEGKKQKMFGGALGKWGDVMDAGINFFIRLTSLIILGFNWKIGIGNILAGKYQEIRKRGYKQFARGEKRFFTNWEKTQQILKDYRIIEHSFDDLVHKNHKKGFIGVIEKWSFWFMESSEYYIQGAAFLGALTEEEYSTGVVSDIRMREINNSIATIQGEGYSPVDQRMLSMYALGRGILQFKKWFVTLVGDRFQPYDIDRFGKVQAGSLTASGAYTKGIVNKLLSGKMTMKDFVTTYNDLKEEQQAEVMNMLRGTGLAIMILGLILALESEGEDEEVIRTLRKSLNDLTVMTDYDRFVNYTMKPAFIGTIQNILNTAEDMSSQSTYQRKSKYADKGDKKWKTSVLDTLPGGLAIKQLY